MNNVLSVTTRFVGPRCHKSTWLTLNQFVRGVSSTCRQSTTSNCRRPHSRTVYGSLQTSSSRCRTFTTTRRNLFRPSLILQKLKQYDQTREPGLSFQKEPLEEADIAHIFGEIYPEPELGDRILKVLHARRVDGTLDLPYDEELKSVFESYPESVDHALKWLRTIYPIDEDAAITGRFEREESPREQEHPSALTERGQKLGLIKYQEPAQIDTESPEAELLQQKPLENERQADEYVGPQSGKYYAPLSEREGDVFGRSKIEEMKAQNEADWKEQEEKLQAEIDRSMEEAKAKYEEKSQALASRPEQGIEVSEGELPVRPPNEFEKWIIRAQQRAQTRLTLDSPEIANLTTAGRILPSLLFVLTSCALIYLWASYWEPPRRSERMFPDISLAYATVGGILAANVLVFLLWKFPPAVRLLNKYFIVTPAYPRMLSMIGNIFSHQSAQHLALNMLGLVVFGHRLHEDVGRANFIAIWLFSGLIGSVVSLSSFALRGFLLSSSLGSSGCIWGIIAAHLWIHKDDNFSIILLPEEWRKKFEGKGYVVLPILVIIDVVMSLRRRNIDLAAHLAGMTVGVSCAEWWRSQRKGHKGGLGSITRS